MERTLPYAWYTDPEILRREQERIFRGSWQYVGHLGELQGPGSYFTTRAGRTPIVVTRARDGMLRGFLNVCRHRGFPVADGAGTRETIQCPYHAWTYDLDGSLRAAPRSDEEEEFPREELGLREVSVDTWGPFVFANTARDCEPLADPRARGGRAAALAVPLPLAEPRREHLPREAEHLDRADDPDLARPHLPLPRLLLRAG